MFHGNAVMTVSPNNTVKDADCFAAKRFAKHIWA